MRRYLVIAACLLACGGDPFAAVTGAADSGVLTAATPGSPPPDASVPPLDGGPAPDASLPAPDSGAAPDAAAPADAGTDAGAPLGATFEGCPMFPASNEWNRDISGDPVDPHSADYLAFMGASSLYLHPDFGGQYGQPFAVVDSSQARVPMTFLYASQSEPGPYPYPLDVPIQADTDRHATVLDKSACFLYETYLTVRQGDGFHGDSGAVFDLIHGTPRPDGWTSATASGLPILPGMARYDEAVERGEVPHALAFIAGATAHAYVAPATHSAGTSDALFAPPMGLRVRLKASYDLSHFTGASLAIARALQRYGMFLDDNAGATFWSLSGSLDSRWPLQDLEQLKSIPANAFEVVKLPSIRQGL